MQVRSGIAQRLAAVATAVGVAAALAACNDKDLAVGGGGRPGAAREPVAVVTVASATGTTQRWSRPLQIAVRNAQLTAVTVTDAAGRALTGRLTPAAWTSVSSRLLPVTVYRAVVRTRTPRGTEATWTVSVKTTDATRLRPVLVPGDGAVVGVGLPLVVQFNKSVDSKMQPAVARRLTVTAQPAQPGGWRWVSATELHWRPS